MGDKILALIEDALREADQEKDRYPSRELSLVRTKLEEAWLWRSSRVLRAQIQEL